MSVMEIAVADSLDEALSALPVHTPSSSPLILPSSGRRQDPVVANIRRVLRGLGLNSTILLPSGLSTLAPFSHPEGGASVPASIDVPGQPSMDVSLPTRMLSSCDIWIVTDVDAVAGRGPHALDLAVRYLRPSDRLRGLRSRDHTWIVAVNSLLRISRLASTARIDGLVVATSTRDLIAGELAALAMAGLHLPRSSSVTGVWEDPLVQRATELQLGVPYPGLLAPSVTIATGNGRAHEILKRIFTTIGVSTS